VWSAGSDVQVRTLRGLLSARAGRQLQVAMSDALHQAPLGVVVDLGGVDQVDSDGVRLLVLVRRHARRLSATLPIAGARPAVAQALRRLDITGLFHLYATTHEAIAALHRRGQGRGGLGKTKKGVYSTYAMEVGGSPASSKAMAGRVRSRGPAA
jgi:anti-anti-sigma factor